MEPFGKQIVSLFATNFVGLSNLVIKLVWRKSTYRFVHFNLSENRLFLLQKSFKYFVSDYVDTRLESNKRIEKM